MSFTGMTSLTLCTIILALIIIPGWFEWQLLIAALKAYLWKNRSGGPWVAQHAGSLFLGVRNHQRWYTLMKDFPPAGALWWVIADTQNSGGSAIVKEPNLDNLPLAWRLTGPRLRGSLQRPAYSCHSRISPMSPHHSPLHTFCHFLGREVKC